MEYLDVLKRICSYNAWANSALLDSLEKMPDLPNGVGPILGHLVGAEQLWLDRLHGDNETIKVWPELSVADCKRELAELEEAWELFIENQRPEKLLRPVAYVNTKNVPWANRVEEILTHVALHGSYHRGQIALLVRQHGGEPILTDYIHAVRTGLVE